MLLQCGCAKAVIVPPWIDHRDICLQPPPEDDCGALVARWFYDRYTQTCQKFTYGGCEGNENNFPTLQACLEKCGKIKRVPERCRLEVSEGICRSMIKRYFFNLTSMRCEKFYYGGCEGNENRFHSKVSCLDHCLPIRSNYFNTRLRAVELEGTDPLHSYARVALHSAIVPKMKDSVLLRFLAFTTRQQYKPVCNSTIQDVVATTTILLMRNPVGLPAGKAGFFLLALSDS
ncbi:Tissue factor pathway inhibitor 2 [Varanus komodoensis]|nr:Tissue factor pathway inhibitor 2 [Varanus komodoensis]